MAERTYEDGLRRALDIAKIEMRGRAREVGPYADDRKLYQSAGGTAAACAIGDSIMAELKAAKKAATREANLAKNFPVNTCPASRHVRLMAEALMAGEPYAMLAEEPDHCGESMLSVVTSLWEARTEIERLKATLAEAGG